MIDIHTHILPGLDDGPATEDEAIEMCRTAAADGTRVIVATPHLFSGYAVTRQAILDGVQALRRRLAREGIALDILPGADVHADADLLSHVRSGRAMTLADGGKYMLVEMSRDVLPPGFEELLFELHLIGICPVITHPERHRAIQSEPELLLPLIDAGNVIQITAGSLSGEFGRDAEKSSRELVRRRMAHVVASDAHSATRRSPRLSDARRIVAELSGAAEAQDLFQKVPAAFIAGKEIQLPTPVKPGRSWLEKLPWLQSSGRPA